MSPGAVRILLCLLGVSPKGSSEMVRTQQTVMAAVGQEAHFSCQLMQSKYVLQVTWQRVLSEQEVNLATYSDVFGSSVNLPFVDKVEFQETGLQHSSIVLRRVTKQDECCYRCLFDTYPDGALTGNMCLKVYEQPEPVLRITKSNSSEESLVSCSVTGQPTPTVTLIVPGRGLGSSDYSTVANANGTVTVTATAALSGFHGNSTQVGCVVRLLSGAVTEVFTTIPDAVRSFTGFPVLLSTSGAAESGFSATMTGVVAACTAAGVLVFCLLVVLFTLQKQRNEQNRLNNDPERKKTPTIEDTQETQEPFVTQENEQIRQRSTPQKEETKTKPLVKPVSFHL